MKFVIVAIAIALALLFVSYEAKALAADRGTYLVFVHSDECLPCRNMLRQVLAARRHGIPVRGVNLSRHPEFGKRYRINRLPTLLRVTNGRIVARRVGYAAERGIREFFESR